MLSAELIGELQAYPVEVQAQIIESALAEAVQGLPEQYQVPAIQATLGGIFDPYIPQLTAALEKIAIPIAEKAGSAAAPAIKEAVMEYAPTAIAIAAGLFLFGSMWSLFVVKQWGLKATA